MLVYPELMTTPLNTTTLEVLIAILKKDYMQYPQPIKGDT
jgi:hypothetical protein